jgi:hypothetical protein
MNRTCNGNYIPSINMYRCLYDGTMVEAEAKPTVCTHCKRDAFPTTVRRPKLRTVILKQVRVGDQYHTYEIEGFPTKK